MVEFDDVVGFLFVVDVAGGDSDGSFGDDRSRKSMVGLKKFQVCKDKVGFEKSLFYWRNSLAEELKDVILCMRTGLNGLLTIKRKDRACQRKKKLRYRRVM